jgi:hypothetical protein
LALARIGRWRLVGIKKKRSTTTDIDSDISSGWSKKTKKNTKRNRHE